MRIKALSILISVSCLLVIGSISYATQQITISMSTIKYNGPASIIHISAIKFRGVDTNFQNIQISEIKFKGSRIKEKIGDRSFQSSENTILDNLSKDRQLIETNKSGGKIFNAENLKKRGREPLDQKASKSIFLLPSANSHEFSEKQAVPLKIRHNYQRDKFQYTFEKWDTKRNKWVKTSQPKMARSQTSPGSDMAMTTAYFRFKKPGKYRWGIYGLSPQKRQEIVVGETAAKKVAAKASSIKSADSSKSPKLVPSVPKNKLSAGDSKSLPKKGKPSIWFDLTTKPAPTPQLNKAFNIVIGAKNIGTGKNGSSPSNKVVVKLNCQTLTGGGHCEKLLGDPVVPTIEPGEKETLNFRSAFKVTKGGKYRVSVVLDPVPKAKGLVNPNLKKSYNFDFNVIEYTFPKNETIKKKPQKIQKRVSPKAMKTE